MQITQIKLTQVHFGQWDNHLCRAALVVVTAIRGVYKDSHEGKQKDVWGLFIHLFVHLSIILN